MTLHNLILHVAKASTLFSVVLFSCLSTASAGTFSWGDISDPAGDVMYLDVREDNDYATSLFAPEPGTGSPTAVGNSIMFDPQNFLSSSNNGSDTVDSTMKTTVMAVPGKAIDNIQISELGDYTLSGLSGGAATATVGAAFFWSIEEINGLPNPQPQQAQNMIVTTGSGANGGEYARPGDDGTATIWTGSVFIDVAGYMLANNISGAATKVSLKFDNTLTTAADQFSSAFIKKKEIGGAVTVTVDTSSIPEPSTIALAGLALVGLVVAKRRAA